MAGIVYTKLIDALKGIGVDVSQQSGSNVKKLATKNKSTATKPGLLASERDTGGNFATVLDIFKDEAKYIDSMNDAEQMAFLNNIIDYNEFGGPKIKTTSELNQQAKDLGLEFKGLKSESEDLQTSVEELQGLAKKMKDEAEANKKRALQDLEDFISTGGQPLKKKDDKFLGGSMHEEGQLRTGIRQFLQTEYKNGRLKLDDLDKERVMQYSPMSEHDPILVFKRIYGDEAYKKAGEFPGAFEIGENFKHYEEIFRENMGEDLLKVKDKKYVGDGTLVLTDEVYEPIPDDDVPFAKGGRASFAGGKLVSEIIAAIVKKEPIEAMKEVNKVIGKKGKYKNLTDDDVNKIVEGTDDWIMQRDPDNLYVYDDGKTIYDDDLTKEQLIEKESRAMDKADEMSVEDSLKTLEGLGATQTAERFRLKQKYPGITDDLLDKILMDDNPQRKAEVLATIDEAFKMMEKGKGPDEIVEIFKNTKRTKNAKGGRAGFYMGGQSTIEPDLSDIGHGSDSLMSRNRILAPNSQATTSTGLNYLLGEDNDNTRIPFNEGLLVPPSKPYTTDQFDEDSMLYLKGMYGLGGDGKIMMYNKMIEKGNQLRNQGVERETVIEIIRNNKNKIDEILRQQEFKDVKIKSLAGLKDGGRIGYATKGKVSLSDLPSLQGLKNNNIGDSEGGIGSLARRPMMGQAARERKTLIDKAIAKFTYAVDNLDQEERSLAISAFNDQLQLGYSTTMSGLKMDAADKLNIVPIDKETIYSAIVNMDLPKKLKLKMSAMGDAAGSEELSFSLANNDLGITYDNQSQEIIGQYQFDSKDGSLSITPAVKKDADSKITKSIEIDKAIDDGYLNLDITDTDDSSLFKFKGKKDGQILNLEKGIGDENYLKGEFTTDFPLYMIKDNSFSINEDGVAEKNYLKPSLVAKYNSDDFTNYGMGASFPITPNLSADIYSTKYADDTSTDKAGLYYNKALANDGILSFGGEIDSDRGKNFMLNFSLPFGDGNINRSKPENILMPYHERKALEQKKLEEEYLNNLIYGGSDFNKLKESVSDFDLKNFIGPVQLASGGIASLRPGYAGGSLVDKGRRGFLKFLGGTAAGVVALKTGLAKLLGKESGAVSKKVIDEVIIEGGTGAPAWLQPLVNKALREGTDKTKSLAYKDAQEVKRLDTPTGKVDVYYDVRTGEVEIDYIGGNTALGESVQMRYTPGIADEGTKGKPADEFQASESIPEGRGYSYGDEYDYSIDMGENTVGDVKGLYSDTSELAELGGQKPLIKDISETIKKKKVLKQMDEDPAQFITEVQGDYVPD